MTTRAPFPRFPQQRPSWPAAPPPRRRRTARVVRTTLAVVVAVLLVAAVAAWVEYRDVVGSLRRSGALSGLAATPTADTNILIIGLDSRLDEDGKPLPDAVYQAMHTGDADVGGYNANVLMLVHVAADGHAQAVSVPRDDYVPLAGSPDGVAKGKIKQAYGLALDQRRRELIAQGVTDRSQLEQRSRDAGRDAEITTVGRFLGVPVDHVVEVTMAAFYQVAQAVAPITVCLAEDTQDSYSGADFHAGVQQIDAAQAMAFVRQRRDTAHPHLDFSDLDRERRQQAFIASLMHQLKQAGTIADPARLAALTAAARQNTAVDPGFDPLALAEPLADGSVTFTTLPIDHFGTDPRGESVNVVDAATVRAVVQRLFSGAAPEPVATPSTAAPVPPGPTDRHHTRGTTSAVPATKAAAPAANSSIVTGGIPCVK